MLLREMEQPVVIEVAAGAQRAEPQDRLCARKGPARTRAAHAVLDKVAARTLDDASRDREPVCCVARPEAVLVADRLAVPDEPCGGAEAGRRIKLARGRRQGCQQRSSRVTLCPLASARVAWQRSRAAR